MEVIYTGIRQTPQMVVQAAAQEDVSVLGLSILSGAHMELMPEIMRLLGEQGMDDVLVVLGGIVPEADREPLATMGVAAVFGPELPPTTLSNILTPACPPIRLLGLPGRIHPGLPNPGSVRQTEILL